MYRSWLMRLVDMQLFTFMYKYFCGNVFSTFTFELHMMRHLIFTKLYLLLFITWGGKPATSQPYPVNYFSYPMDTPILLSAPFGALRENHFHSGMDIRTGEKIGLPVYAVADGYVSRIKYASTAYGKAIYITHNNGFTSVYAHLQKAEGKLADYIREYHYEKEVFEFDHFPAAQSLPVKKGEIIGRSGNSGTSTGPHLHFEIRKTRTEEIVNPQLLGIRAVDTLATLIKKIATYSLQKNSPGLIQVIDLSTVKTMYTDSGWVVDDTIRVPSGLIGFGTEAVDWMYDNKREYSIYALQLDIDGKKIHTFELERFAFEATRCINVHMDYAYYQKTGIRLQKLFTDEGNRIQLYPYQLNRGKYILNDTLTHFARIKAFDVNGKYTSVYFRFKAKNAVSSPPAIIKPGFTLFSSKTSGTEFSDFKIQAAPGVLYATQYISYSKENGTKNMLSAVHMLGENSIVPLHRNLRVSIKPNRQLSGIAENKLLMCATGKNGTVRSIGGSFDKGWVSASTNQFADWFIGADTVAPIIKPLAISNGMIRDTVSIKFQINDDLSGICCYKSYINGKWELFEYDAKNDLLEYFLTENSPRGKLDIEIIVWDKKENSQTLKISVERP
jgi:hypothetical protein